MAELIVEPDAEVVQSYPRRQATAQTLKLMGSLPPQAEGVEQLVIDRLHDLADSGHPPPQALGPAPLAGVAFGWMDNLCSVAFEPPEVVLGPLKTLVCYVGSGADRAHASQPRIWAGSNGEEGFRHLLVGDGGSCETEAGNDPGRVDRGEQAKALIPAQAVRPTDVSIPGQPSMPPALAIPDRHRRAIQGLVRALLCNREKARQMRDESLDELGTGAHQAVELRAVGHSGESLAQVSLSVAVEISLAGETAPTSKDGQGNDLALGEGGIGNGSPFWRLGVAEVVDHNVEYGEEGVHIEHKESVSFPSGSVSKPTLMCGHLPLKFRSNNSHQAFKETGVLLNEETKSQQGGKRNDVCVHCGGCRVI